MFTAKPSCTNQDQKMKIVKASMIFMYQYKLQHRRMWWGGGGGGTLLHIMGIIWDWENCITMHTKSVICNSAYIKCLLP